VVETEIDGCVALFNPDSGEAVFLNETASDIWRLSDGEISLEDVVTRLAGAYDTDRATIGEDVRHTVSDLQHRGFLAPRLHG